MTAERLHGTRAGRTPVSLPVGLLLAGLAVLLVAPLSMPIPALALGWLVGWVFCLSITTGAAIWFLIAALTGGRWIEAGRPWLSALGMATPLVAAAGLLFIPAAPVLFPWWPADGSADTSTARETLYLNPAFFGIRAAGVLILWSLLGLMAPRGLPAPVAAIALVLYAVSVSVAGADWILSLDPSFVSTTFGAFMAIAQLGLALALVAALGLAQDQPGEGRAAPVADWGGLMLATVLGVFYLGAMQFLVSWSGNLPHKAAWYLARNRDGGAMLMALSFALGTLLPFCLLLVSRLRRDRLWLRRVGCMMLTGAFLQLLWLAAPGRQGLAGAAALAIVALAAGTGGVLRGRWGGQRHG